MEDQNQQEKISHSQKSYPLTTLTFFGIVIFFIYQYLK